MITASTTAGRRLAKARAKQLDIQERPEAYQGKLIEVIHASEEFHLAAAALADELLVAGHGRNQGD